MTIEPNSLDSRCPSHYLLEQLESEWLRNDIPDIAPYLAAACPAGAELVHNLVELDLEYRWKRYHSRTAEGSGSDSHGFPEFPRLENYANLLQQDQRHLILTPELLAEEYRVRMSWGDHPTKREYMERLPLDSVAIESALKQIDTEFEIERATPVVDEEESSAAADESTWLVKKENQAEPKPVENVPVSAVIGKYELVELLGRGGFGEVWKSYDPDLKRHVALKIPRRDRQFTTETLNYFRSEAQKMATLERVPGIVPVYEAGDANGQVYIVSYLVQGEDLGQRFRRDDVPYEETARIVAEVAETLHRAHLKDLFHRDVKLSNILIGDDGDIFLSDFGLCVSEQEQLKEGHSATGTYAYMAPEQVQGFSHRLDGRADIYALGVVLYRLLTGRLPYLADTPREYLQQVVDRETRPPRSVKDDIPPELERICLKCLAKKVTDRYTTARDLANDLKQFLSTRQPAAGLESTATLRSPSQRVTPAELQSAVSTGRSSQRKTALFSFAGVLVLALIWAILPNPDPPPVSPPPPPPPEPFKVSVITKPPGAKIVVYPIVEPYGFPDGEQRVETQSQSPATLELKPGYYLVVAALEDGRFHEVYRTVPARTDDAQSIYKHRTWNVKAGGGIEWPQIVIPPVDVTDRMARFEGAPKFEMGEAGNGLTPRHKRHVGSFYMDCTEAVWGDYLQFTNGDPPLSLMYLKDILPDDNMPLAGIWFDDAMALAERLGKRLPTEAEYELAATAGGTQPYPWGSDTRPLEKWTFEIAGKPDDDHTNTMPPVYGLYSNVAEWTMSWAVPYPPRMEISPIPPVERGDTYVIRGGPNSIIDRDPDPLEFAVGPRFRTGRYRKDLLRGVGLRCVRSARPRLQASDLERYIPD